MKEIIEIAYSASGDTLLFLVVIGWTLRGIAEGIGGIFRSKEKE